MDNREMLELAAKAVGYEYEYTDHTGRGEFEQHQIRNEQGCLVDWNPLEDDGDCARMESKLSIDVEWGMYAAFVCLGLASKSFCELYANHKGDKDKARRYASTRLAAEIGKDMP